MECGKVNSGIRGFKHCCRRQWTKMPQTQRWSSTAHLKTTRPSKLTSGNELSKTITN